MGIMNLHVSINQFHNQNIISVTGDFGMYLLGHLIPSLWVTYPEFPWRREWKPTPVSFPGESHGQRSLAGYSP